MHTVHLFSVPFFLTLILPVTIVGMKDKKISEVSPRLHELCKIKEESEKKESPKQANKRKLLQETCLEALHIAIFLQESKGLQVLPTQKDIVHLANLYEKRARYYRENNDSTNADEDNKRSQRLLTFLKQ